MLGAALPECLLDGSGIRNYVTATYDRLQRRTTPMIDLYYWTTPNGHKITMFLEETAVPYNIMPVNIGKGEQFKSQFLDVSPNNRIPAIVDRAPAGGGEPIAVFESGAILLYLAEKTGRFLPRDARARIDAIQWLFWQMGNLRLPLACLRSGAFHRGCGLAEQDRALLRGADAAHVGIDGLRLLVGAFDRRARTDGFEPTLEMRKIGDVLPLPLVRHDPGIDRHVGNGIVTGDERAIRQSLVQHAVEPVDFVAIAV